jgi:DNA-binding response OmpR family regulator
MQWSDGLQTRQLSRRFRSRSRERYRHNLAVSTVRPSQPVLVVEDHQDVRDMLETLLAVDGYQVRTAAHGRQALESIEREPPCVILLDVMMPVMDGVTFARALRGAADPVVAQTPIVLVTAVSDADKVRQQTGALDVIPKPIDMDKVVETVGRLCRRSYVERR